MIDMKDMELRDWFAGQALEGILANAQYPAQGSGEPLDQFSARVAERAYRIAEAMAKYGQKLKKESTGTW